VIGEENEITKSFDRYKNLIRLKLNSIAKIPSIGCKNLHDVPTGFVLVSK
jgi:hypothetical protein